MKFRKSIASVVLGGLTIFGGVPGASAQVVVDRVGSITLHTTPGALNAGGAPDYASGVQAVAGDISPTAAASGINNYLFQDEQINISPEDGVVTVLRTDQKNLVQPFITKVFELENANPREVVNVFRVMCGKEGGRAEVLIDSVNKKNFIQVICPPFQLPFVEQVISVIDNDWSEEYNDGASEIYYKAKYRDVASVNALAFDNGTPDQSVIAIDTRNNAVKYLDDPGSIQGYLAIAKQVDIPPHQVVLEGAVYELNDQDDTKIGLDYIAWKNGPGRNLFNLILSGHKQTQSFHNVSSIFDAFVPPRTQDATQNRVHMRSSSSQELFSANALLTAAYLDFLEIKGKAKVVARPRIVAKSGRTGTFERVDQIVSFEAAELINPFGSVVDANLTTNPGFFGTNPDRLQQLLTNDQLAALGEGLIANPTFSDGGGNSLVGDNSVSPRVLRRVNSGQTGIFMSVLPYIGTESLEATVNVTVSDLNGYTPQGQPIINSRTVNSSVRLFDGKPLVIAGLTRQEEAEAHQGMPFFSKIPILGYLFGGDTTTDHENKLIIILTPTVSLGEEDQMGVPKEVETLMAQAKGEDALEVPENSFGFDMWLLDPEKSGI